MKSGAITDVPVAPVSPRRFEEVLGNDGYAALVPEIERASERLRDRVVWHVSSTARGGGVAEMLRSHLSYVRGAGVDARWVVIGGDAPFFEVTKRLHNNLHENDGDGKPLDAAAGRIYEDALAAAAVELAGIVRPGDVVFLHDPQTAGLAGPMRAAGARVLWRCHIGIDRPGPTARGAWDFLRPFVLEAEAWIFSRREFIWDGLDDSRVWLVPPTIDAFSPKNQDLSDDAVSAILAASGLTGSDPVAPPTFTRTDGSPGRVNRAARIEADGPLDREASVIAQVSRWDRLKDPSGLLEVFADHVESQEASLLLVGPDVEAVDDDPEGAAVLAEVRAGRLALPEETRGRVHLVSLPMDDIEENAAMVNAIQRCADVVVQKSLAEGFGLTVAEAMWKRRPVVAGRVGGIQDQIVNGVSGVLVDDPADLPSVGAAINGLLDDPRRAGEMGIAARERVTSEFLAIGRILDYFRHIEALID